MDLQSAPVPQGEGKQGSVCTEGLGWTCRCTPIEDTTAAQDTRGSGGGQEHLGVRGIEGPGPGVSWGQEYRGVSNIKGSGGARAQKYEGVRGNQRVRNIKGSGEIKGSVISRSQ